MSGKIFFYLYTRQLTAKFRTHVFVGIVKLICNSIAMTENISIVFQLFLSFIVKSQFNKKKDFSKFKNYFYCISIISVFNSKNAIY
jgi:hypothetical protein